MSFFLAHYATVEDVIAEYGSPDLSIEGLASPRFTGAYESHYTAVRMAKEAAINSLREFVTGGKSYEHAYGGGTWSDGDMRTEAGTRPRSIHKYRKGERLVALVVVEYVTVEG
jgi:hypothetical protein